MYIYIYIYIYMCVCVCVCVCVRVYICWYRKIIYLFIVPSDIISPYKRLLGVD